MVTAVTAVTDFSQLMATVAVEYEKWLAAEAKKRQGERTDLADIKEKFPQSGRGPQASDEAGAMLGVSGRTVRDLTGQGNCGGEALIPLRHLGHVQATRMLNSHIVAGRIVLYPLLLCSTR